MVSIDGRHRSRRGADLRRRRRARRHRHVDFLDQVAELRIEAIARLFQIDGDFANDAARIGREQQDAVAHQHRFLDIVGHQNDALDRQLAVAPQLEEIGAQRLRREHVERRERLVHQQDIRMNDQRAGKADALAHAAGELARIGGFVAVEADEIDRRQRALADFHFGKAERLEAELDVFQHRQPGKQRERLEHHGDAGRRPEHRLAEIGDGAGRRRHQAGDRAQQRRFARSGAAEKPDDLALDQLQLDAVEHQKLAAVGARKGLAQPMDVEKGGAAHDAASTDPELAFRVKIKWTPERAIDENDEQAHHRDAEHDAVEIAGLGLLAQYRRRGPALRGARCPSSRPRRRCWHSTIRRRR